MKHTPSVLLIGVGLSLQLVYARPAALTNFQMIANAVMTTEEVARAFGGHGASR
jgi:hypothetical protein